MRDFMAFCLQVLTGLVGLFFDFDIGGYSYGNFLVVSLLVSTLVGALVVRFGPSRSDYVGYPPRSGGSGSGSPGSGAVKDS